jgi:metal-dependent hydrolase (beta-lactamase superfamily II)
LGQHQIASFPSGRSSWAARTLASKKILDQAKKIDPWLYTVTGGFHLVRTSESEVRRVGRVLRDELKISRVAPAHCTSELGFSVLRELFGPRFDEAGLAAVITLPETGTHTPP